MQEISANGTEINNWYYEETLPRNAEQYDRKSYGQDLKKKKKDQKETKKNKKEQQEKKKTINKKELYSNLSKYP